MAEVLNKILDVAILIAIALAAVVAVDTAKVIIGEPIEPTQDPTTAPTTAATQEPTQVPTETTQPATEATAPPETTIETEPPLVLYDVPLSRDLQVYIISLCEELHTDPAIVMAMIWRESNFDPKAVGDNGESHGLMQIQPKWNMDLMEQLGHHNLFEPFSNVTVGIHILAYQIDRYDGDTIKAIVSYNQGHYYGTVTDYAKDVLAKAEELRGTTYEANRQWP